MQAVILAGGTASRLHSLSSPIPKPLIPVFDRPLIEHTVKLLSRQGFTDIIIAMSHQAGDIAQHVGDGSQWGANVRYSVEAEPMGSAGAVKLVQGMIEGTFLVVSGDLITDIDLPSAVRLHRLASSLATIVLHQAADTSQFGIVDCDSEGRVHRFIEKPKSAEVFGDIVSTGIYVLEPEVLSSIPYNTAQDFATNLFPRLLRNLEPVFGFELPGYWCDAGDPVRYRSAHFDALQGRLKLDLPAIYVGEGIWVGEGVDIDPTVQLSSPVYVGSGAKIRRGAVLGAHTVIGANALVDEEASVSRTVVGAGARIGRGTEISDCVIRGGYLVTETGTTGEPAPTRARAAQFAPAAEQFSAKQALA